MKYKVELSEIPPGVCLPIGEADTFKECMQIIDNYLIQFKIESYTKSCLYIDEKAIVDYGSHFYFFYISHTDGSEVNAWEIEFDEL